MEDELKLEMGREFESLNEAWNFWNEYGRKIGFGVRKQNGTKSKKDGSIITYRYVCCKEGVRRKDKKCTTASRYRPETRTKCQAQMIVSRVGQKFKVTKFNEEHNHPLYSQETTHLLSSQRNLSEAHACEMDLAEEAGLEPREAFDLMSTYAGGQENLGYTMIDAKNYLMNKRRSHMKYEEVGCLLEYFQKQIAENPSFYHKYQLDMEQQITNVFWADACMLKDYAHFGEVVSLDTTYSTNKNHRPLAIFSGFNHHRSVVIFGAALMYDETIDSFKWLLETFLDAHTQNKPQTIFTDQDQSMARALSEVLPKTRHCLCTWHLMQNGIKHLGNLMKEGSHFLTDFKKCMFDYVQVDKFEEAWSELLCCYDVHENGWLNNTYNIKEKWARCYMADAFTLGMRSTQISESVNAEVKRCTEPKLDINRFFKRFEKVVAKKRSKELQLEYESLQKIPRMVNQSAPILRQLVQSYTHTAFDMFQEQWDLQFAVKLIDRNEKEPLFVYTAHMIDEDGEWKIEFNPVTHEVCCNCRKFETTGILCCHALKVYESKDVRVMPAQYILKRWTKEARNGVVHDIKGNEIQADPKLEKTRRYRQLMSMMVSLAAEAADTHEGFTLVQKGILELKNEIPKRVENVTSDLVIDSENMPKDSQEASSSGPMVQKTKKMLKKKDTQSQVSSTSYLEASIQHAQTQYSTVSFSVPTHNFPPSTAQQSSFTSLLMAQGNEIPSLEATDVMTIGTQGK